MPLFEPIVLVYHSRLIEQASPVSIAGACAPNASALRELSFRRMSEGALVETWEFKLSQPPSALWPLLADTNRIHEALEMPRYQIVVIEA